MSIKFTHNNKLPSILKIFNSSSSLKKSQDLSTIDSIRTEPNQEINLPTDSSNRSDKIFRKKKLVVNSEALPNKLVPSGPGSTRNFNLVFNLNKESEINSKFKFPPPRINIIPNKLKVLSGSEKLFPEKYSKNKPGSFKINLTKEMNVVAFEIEKNTAKGRRVQREKNNSINNRYMYSLNNRYKGKQKLSESDEKVSPSRVRLVSLQKPNEQIAMVKDFLQLLGTKQINKFPNNN